MEYPISDREVRPTTNSCLRAQRKIKFKPFEFERKKIRLLKFLFWLKFHVGINFLGPLQPLVLDREGYELVPKGPGSSGGSYSNPRQDDKSRSSLHTFLS